MRTFSSVALILLAPLCLQAQSINSGTVTGSITDQTQAVVTGAKVTLRNPVTGYEQTTTTDNTGIFRFTNVPLNPYQLTAAAAGFKPTVEEVDVRSSVPITLDLSLAVGSSTTTVNVSAAPEILETDPSAHVDVDRNQLLKLPVIDPGAGLSEAIVYSTGGVAADANGFFHPLGDHAQVSFVIDGQPISDQQSKLFSTQRAGWTCSNCAKSVASLASRSSILFGSSRGCFSRHGGVSTGPRTRQGMERCRLANWKHGEYSARAIEQRRMFRRLSREMRDTLTRIRDTHSTQ